MATCLEIPNFSSRVEKHQKRNFVSLFSHVISSISLSKIAVICLSIKYPFNLARLRISIILHITTKIDHYKVDNQQTVSLFLD